MIDAWKNYSNKYNRHLCPVCKLEEETMHHLVACNMNMSFEDFRKVYGNESRDKLIQEIDLYELVIHMLKS